MIQGTTHFKLRSLRESMCRVCCPFSHNNDPLRADRLTDRDNDDMRDVLQDILDELVAVFSPLHDRDARVSVLWTIRLSANTAGMVALRNTYVALGVLEGDIPLNALSRLTNLSPANRTALIDLKCLWNWNKLRNSSILRSFLLE